MMDREEDPDYRVGQGQATRGSGEDQGGSNQGTFNEDNWLRQITYVIFCVHMR